MLISPGRGSRVAMQPTAAAAAAGSVAAAPRARGALLPPSRRRHGFSVSAAALAPPTAIVRQRQQQTAAAAAVAPARLAAARRRLCVVAARGLTSNDEDREEGRRYRRTVFTADRWKQHRSITRYFATLSGVMSSRIVSGLLPPLTCVLLVSYIVCVYEQLLDDGALAAAVPGFPWPDLSVSPEGPFSNSTFALSLLLVFRTNSSYERWTEAAAAWNEIVAAATHLGRQVTQWLPSDAPADAAPRAALLRWLAALPAAAAAEAREEPELLPQLLDGTGLEPTEHDALRTAPHPASLTLSVVGTLLANSRMTIDSKTHCDESVRRLQDALDVITKIKETPIPLSYSSLTLRFLIAWLTFLPFVSWGELGWATVPCDCLLAFFLLGIEEVGRQVEDPIGLLALEHGCEVVQERMQRFADERPAVLALAAAARSGGGAPPGGVPYSSSSSPPPPPPSVPHSPQAQQQQQQQPQLQSATAVAAAAVATAAVATATAAPAAAATAARH